MDSREALRESDERFRFLAELLPVQIWTALPDGALDFVTDQTARFFGLSPEQILRDGWKDVVHPDDLGGVGARWMHSLSTGEPYEVEFRLRAVDGTYEWHLGRAVAQKNAAGAVVRWFGTNTNIEAQREEQRRMAALLEEVAAQSKEHEEAILLLRQQLEDARAAR